MEQSTKKLLQMKERLNTATRELDKATGSFETVMEDIKKQFKQTTLDTATKALDKINEEIETEELTFITGVNKTWEQYDWSA